MTFAVPRRKVSLAPRGCQRFPAPRQLFDASPGALVPPGAVRSSAAKARGSGVQWSPPKDRSRLSSGSSCGEGFTGWALSSLGWPFWPSSGHSRSPDGGPTSFLLRWPWVYTRFRGIASIGRGARGAGISFSLSAVRSGQSGRAFPFKGGASTAGWRSGVKHRSGVQRSILRTAPRPSTRLRASG